MRKLRVSVDQTGWIVEEKGWFFWKRICRGLDSPETAQFVIDSIKDQPK